METKPLNEIIHKLNRIKFNYTYDLVVGIARGGIVPSYLLSSILNIPLEFLWINFRDDHHQPYRDRPTLLKPFHFKPDNKKILLVDDRANSGQTIEFARSKIKDAALVESLVINGKADYNIFEEVCFALPWDLRYVTKT